MTSLYNQDIILVLFSGCIKQDYKNKYKNKYLVTVNGASLHSYLKKVLRPIFMPSNKGSSLSESDMFIYNHLTHFCRNCLKYSGTLNSLKHSKKKSADDILKYFFLIFPRKQDLTFHANCLQWRQFA